MYQVPYTQNHHPNHGYATPQMMSDPHGAPLAYETSQGVLNHGYPVPMGYQGCCSYPYVPGYFNQPYPYYPPPPPFYYHGAYPLLPPMCPVHYPPPPNVPIEQPRYEFDKSQVADYHCCGCHGHQCNRKEDPHVNVEHQEPVIEKTTSKSLVPAETVSNSYPFVSVPQEYMSSREQRNKLEPEHSEQQSSESRIDHNVETAGKRNQKQTEAERNQFPFPIFWVPYKAPEEGKRHHKELDLPGVRGNNIMIKPEEESETRVGTDGGPLEMKNQKSIPMKLAGESEEKGNKDIVKDNSNKENKLKLVPVRQGGENGVKNDKAIVKDTGNKEHKLKSIPVRQGGENGEKKDKEIVKDTGDTGDKEHKLKSVTVRQAGENGEKKDKEIVKEKGEPEKKLSENAAIKSKLPPVCLRVEPLRKRKNGSNGNSRSPSPKRDNNKSIQNDVNGAKSTEGLKKDVELVDGKTKENNTEDARAHSSKDSKENEEKVAAEAKNLEVTNMMKKADKEEVNMLEKTVKEETNLLPKADCSSETKSRMKLSEVEAALIIQSAYRGYEVRRWDPLKKLKQIGEIRVKMTGIRSQIEALEASFDSNTCDKQRLVIGEMIMGFLLKLDTIQGLHPIVREIRKSAAKELVSLQDRLDSLAKNSSPSSTAQLDENPVEAQHKAEVGDGIILESSQAVEQTVIEATCEETKSGNESVPSVCHLNDEVGTKEENILEASQAVEQTVVETTCEEAKAGKESVPFVFHVNDEEGTRKDISSLGGDNLKDERKSSVENMGEIHDDSCNKERKIAQIHDAEHVIDAGSVAEEAEKEIGKGVEEEVGPVSAVCSSQDEGVVEDIISGFVNPQEQKGSSVEDGGESRDDLCSNEVIVTNTEPEIDAGLGSEEVVSSQDDISADQPGVHDGDYSTEGKCDEQIPMQMCEEILDPDSKSPLIDVADTKEATAVTEEPQGSLDECNSNSLSGDLEDEMNWKMDIESDDFHRVQEEEQGGEHKSLADPVESLNVKQDYIEKQEICMEVPKDQGDGTKIAMDTSFKSDPLLEQPSPEPPGVNAEVPIAEEIAGVEGDPELEKMEEIHGVEDAPKPDELKGCGTEVDMVLAEEKRETLDNKYVVAVENIQNKGNVPTAESLDLERQVEIGSEKGVESDKKLVEENEKLKEMVAKLVEAGKEQLTVISSLSGRLKELETKLVRNKKKPKMRRIRVGSSCTKPSDHSVKVSERGVSV